jgi:ubiquinone/menaquinone biosynthesis C-methylase UbiE
MPKLFLKLKKITLPEKTHWGNVAIWYDKTVTNPNSFQNAVIGPNLLRLMNLQKSDVVLDMACGSGFFAQKIALNVAKVVAVDLGLDLINLAKKNNNCPNVEYLYDNAESWCRGEYDQILICLALQNIQHPESVIANFAKMLKKNGKINIVLNHPAFRISQNSEWVWDDQNYCQFRRIDKYLSNQKSEIIMNPSNPNSQVTLSFHRPLQFWFKLFAKNNLCVSNMEEWISHIPQDQGPKTQALENARKEFPMFMYLELRPLS